jgi:hypothetical protein
MGNSLVLGRSQGRLRISVAELARRTVSVTPRDRYNIALGILLKNVVPVNYNARQSAFLAGLHPLSYWVPMLLGKVESPFGPHAVSGETTTDVAAGETPAANGAAERCRILMAERAAVEFNATG